MKILRARVFDDHRRKIEEEHNAARQEKAGSGDRSEKVRDLTAPAHINARDDTHNQFKNA